MKNKLSYFAILFAFIVIFSALSCAEADTKTRIAVIDTTNDKNLFKQANIIANNFIGVMTKTNALSVVERSEIELIKNAQKIDDSEFRYAGTAAKLGKIMGYQYAILSSVVYNIAPIVGVRVVNALTSEIIFADVEFLDPKADNSEILAASSRLAYKFLEKLTGEQAVITEINGKEITINRGSLSGVRKGDLYLVYSGNEKKYVDLAIIQVKDVRVNFSYAELVKNAGDINVLRESDTIMLISKEDSKSIMKRKKFVKKRTDEKKTEVLKAETKFKGYEDCLEAAKKGNAEAQYNLALMYVNGWEVEKDFAKAVEWFRKAAENGLANAQFELGWMYDKGLGIKQDRLKAFEWYRKSAEQGFSKGQNNLGFAYQNGLGVKQDYKKAVSWYRKAAEQGFSTSQYNLALMYENGYGTEPDYKKAIEWYRKAIEQGHATAQNNLGLMYARGRGVKQDYAKALEWYHKSAEQGLDLAQNNIGYAYEYGQGVKQDYTKAAEWYSKAAEQGNVTAQYNLGLLYSNGLGVKQDDAKAVELYSKAVEQNYAPAQNSLGFMYYNGKGVKQDRKKAIELFRKAAEQGYEVAQNNLKILESE